ncbi:LCP family protein [Wukongibacter sp. M2B1]|uniref:LCP family protein n=1 Tax=Wukongibacter sp. M2B1 TaxID=3088895 RepID=UPI003D7A0D57
MKSYFKIFIVTFVCSTLLFGGSVLAFMKFMSDDNLEDAFEEVQSEVKAESSTEPEIEIVEENKSEIEKLIENSSRINILLLGFEGPRTDTIILASFNPENKLIDLISIPRDTYFFDEKYKGTKYDTLGHRKINAAYIRGGVKETMDSVSNILCDVPIDAYVSVTYKGVENIVNSLGGVNVNIPINMNYDDPLAKPELHIHLSKGNRNLNGKQSIQYLRFRKNNNGTGYPDGDLGRIKAQQQFLRSAADKALSLRLPLVVNTAFKFVKSDLDLKKVAYLAKKADGFKKENLKTYTIPGTTTYDGVSYFRHDAEDVEEMLIEIYKQDNMLLN